MRRKSNFSVLHPVVSCALFDSQSATEKFYVKKNISVIYICTYIEASRCAEAQACDVVGSIPIQGNSKLNNNIFISKIK